ncbi:MAG: WbqC family protein [Bacteroidetes bacterium]|nr:WbqC family protein [Bacteroidota bacterium]
MSENNSKILLIEPHYLPPVAWMKLLEGRDRICLDISSSFVKASYRNRCHILSPNGVLHLSIPLQHKHDERKTVGNTKISYEMNWQKNHWMTLTSCYRRSAYFEYFEDLIAPLYHKKFETLLELNMAALKVVFTILKLKPEITFTEQYLEKGVDGYDDYRDLIKPKIYPENTNFEPYNQVFSDRFPFFENLSIIDAIFNKGKFELNEI